MQISLEYLLRAMQPRALVAGPVIVQVPGHRQRADLFAAEWFRENRSSEAWEARQDPPQHLLVMALPVEPALLAANDNGEG